MLTDFVLEDLKSLREIQQEGEMKDSWILEPKDWKDILTTVVGQVEEGEKYRDNLLWLASAAVAAIEAWDYQDHEIAP